MTLAALDTSAPSGLRRLWDEADALRRAAALIGLAVLAVALLAPWIAPYDPVAQSLIARFRPPVGFEGYRAGHLLGTDELGRDILSRSLYALRLTLALALLGATIGLVIGGALGLVAGVAGGRVEAAIMGAVDVQIAVPFTLVALFVLTLFGSTLNVLVVVLGLYGWEQYARIVRAEAARMMAMPFVEAARCAGASPSRIAAVHLLPNLVSPLVVQFTLSLTAIMLLESTLSFLGLGVQPPTATLGAMVGVGRDYMPTAPWIVLAPAILMLLVTFSIQILGDWLRDRADPRLRRR
jgi:peptide/nickel transport system permease protein